jgi:hypothetical protein
MPIPSAAPTAVAVAQFDWNAFLNVALPVIFTTASTVAGIIFGQRNGKKAGSSAMDHAATTLQVAMQAVAAAQQIASAVQQAKAGAAQGEVGASGDAVDGE